MRNYLYGATEKIATAFLGNDVLIDAPCGDVVIFGGMTPRKAFVVTKVKVGFRSVVGDKDFAVLIRAHGAGIDVEIRVKFANAHPEATGLHYGSQCCGGEAFSEGRHHAASDKDVTRHGSLFYLRDATIRSAESNYI